MTFLASLFAVSFSVVAALVPGLDLPGHAGGERPPFPAPPGYLLPWSGGEIHAVTQGEETSLTHNGAAAYAFDFDLDYDTVVAARAGKVVMVRFDSNSGGCSPAFSGAANYVVIDHGDGTSGLYLHLAYGSVIVRPGDLVAQGDPIAVSGETGLTCSGIDAGPGPHLHFQVERTEPGHYFTQSLPIAFDDISENDGVPRAGKSYVSGNFGLGKPQKIKLTPHRVPRPFNPVATPADATLVEGEHIEVPPVAGESTPTPPAEQTPGARSPRPTNSDTPEPSRTPRPTRTPTGTPTPTDTGTPTETPTPTDTPTPTPSDTATPSDTSTATPSGAATAGP